MRVALKSRWVAALLAMVAINGSANESPPSKLLDGSGAGNLADPPQRVEVVAKRPPPDPGSVWVPRDFSSPGSNPSERISSGSRGVKDPGETQKEEPTASEDTKPAACTDNPVILATGEKWKTETDIVAAGLHGLPLSRTYRSFTTRPSLFGPKWLASVEPPTLTFNGC